MCRKAVDLIVAMRSGEPLGKQRLVLQPELVIRNSVCEPTRKARPVRKGIGSRGEESYV